MVKRINKNITKPKQNTLDYSKEYEVSPLKLLVIIVNKYQGDYYLDLLIKKHNVAAAFLCNGHGTATRDIYDLLNISENKKDVVIALVKSNQVDIVLSKILERFNVSKNAKGIAFTIKLDSIIGVLTYRFFTDTKHNFKKEVK